MEQGERTGAHKGAVTIDQNHCLNFQKYILICESNANLTLITYIQRFLKGIRMTNTNRHFGCWSCIAHLKKKKSTESIKMVRAVQDNSPTDDSKQTVI